MSQPTETTRPDPLLDAYRQASDHDGARAGANVRAAVLAHARVVAQAAGSSTDATAIAQATRVTPAANQPRHLWRLAAGVVIGVVGVLIFQLTRPPDAPDTTVAVINQPAAPQVEQTRAPEPPVAAAPATVAAAAAAPATPEASVAAASPPATRERVAAPAAAERAQPPNAAVPDKNFALAKAAAVEEKANRTPASGTASTGVASAAPSAPAAPAAPVAPAALPPPPAVASAADAPASAESSEIVIAAAEAPKRMQSQLRPDVARAASSAPPPVDAPNAFPAASGATVAAARVADASPTQRLTDAELAMFRAVQAGDLAALRSAIARGVNINSKDERGRTALLIARERADTDAVRVLETAGAR